MTTCELSVSCPQWLGDLRSAAQKTNIVFLPFFGRNVVEEQSPSGVASGGEVTSAAGGMVQCQSRSETSSSCQTQYNKLVFKALSGESCTEEEKRSIIAGRTPPTNCDLPYTLVRDQRKQSGYSKRFLRQSFANFD